MFTGRNLKGAEDRTITQIADRGIGERKAIQTLGYESTSVVPRAASTIRLNWLSSSRTGFSVSERFAPRCWILSREERFYVWLGFAGKVNCPFHGADGRGRVSDLDTIKPAKGQAVDTDELTNMITRPKWEKCPQAQPAALGTMVRYRSCRSRMAETFQSSVYKHIA